LVPECQDLQGVPLCVQDILMSSAVNGGMQSALFFCTGPDDEHLGAHPTGMVTEKGECWLVEKVGRIS